MSATLASKASDALVCLCARTVRIDRANHEVHERFRNRLGSVVARVKFRYLNDKPPAPSTTRSR
jgi:hypothetical protein